MARDHYLAPSATPEGSKVVRLAAAGAANNYVPKDDARVIAFTPLVGGGATTRTTFSGKKLVAGTDYSFFCSFPGHSALMKGKLVVTR